MVLFAGKFIINGCPQLISFKSMKKAPPTVEVFGSMIFNTYSLFQETCHAYCNEAVGI